MKIIQISYDIHIYDTRIMIFTEFHIFIKVIKGMGPI